MYEGISTIILDELSAETAAYLTLVHPHYSLLAARIAVSNLHKETNESFYQTIKNLYEYVDKTGKKSYFTSQNTLLLFLLYTHLLIHKLFFCNLCLGRSASLIAKDVFEIVEKNAEEI